MSRLSTACAALQAASIELESAQRLRVWAMTFSEKANASGEVEHMAKAVDELAEAVQRYAMAKLAFSQAWEECRAAWEARGEE